GPAYIDDGLAFDLCMDYFTVDAMIERVKEIYEQNEQSFPPRKCLCQLPEAKPRNPRVF
ncbi:hypothetical protein BX616_010747, partial [Lobosporangium transversale]